MAKNTFEATINKKFSSTNKVPRGLFNPKVQVLCEHNYTPRYLLVELLKMSPKHPPPKKNQKNNGRENTGENGINQHLKVLKK